MTEISGGSALARIDGMGSLDPSSETCDHLVTTSTVIAGLERIVCETCAHVSLRHHSRGVLWPGRTMEVIPPREKDPTEIVVDLTDVPEPKQHRCTACKSPAVFETPYGVACGKHAWIAASKQDTMQSDFWIPLLIHRSGAGRAFDQ